VKVPSTGPNSAEGAFAQPVKQPRTDPIEVPGEDETMEKMLDSDRATVDTEQGPYRRPGSDPSAFEIRTNPYRFYDAEAFNRKDLPSAQTMF
jgi:hypothetical protein